MPRLVCAPANTESASGAMGTPGPARPPEGWGPWRGGLGGDLRPAGMPERCRGPRHARLSQARGSREAPGAPGVLPTACGDRGQARLLVQCGSRGLGRALGATGDEEAGGGGPVARGEVARPGGGGGPTRRGDPEGGGDETPGGGGNGGAGGNGLE